MFPGVRGRREAAGAAASRMPWGTAGRSGAAGCSCGGMPAASSAAEGEQHQRRCPFPLPGAGRCRARRLRLPRGAPGVAGWAGMRGLGSLACRGDGWRRREPAGLGAVFVRSGLMRFQGQRLLSPGVFPAGGAQRGFSGQLSKAVQAAVLVGAMEKHPVFCNVISSSP